MTNKRIERMVDVRVTEHHERDCLRRVGKATRSVKWHAVIAVLWRKRHKPIRRPTLSAHVHMTARRDRIR